MLAGNGYWEEPDVLAVIVVGVIITVKFARANAPRTSSSASSNINGKGDLREWQNADFLHDMELYKAPLEKTYSIFSSLGLSLFV